jgi:hypothetical protein
MARRESQPVQKKMAAASLVSLLCASAALAAEGVTIKKADPTAMELTEQELPSYTVRATTYAAEVYRDGRVRFLAGKTELVRNIVLELGRKVKTLGNIQQEPDNRITLREGEVPKKKPEPGKEGTLDTMSKGLAETMDKPDLPGFTLHFLPDRIEIAPASLRAGKTKAKEGPPPFDLSGVFGDDALAVRNLQSGDEDALPARYICGSHIFSFYKMYGRYWPEIEVTYRDGTKLEVRGISGISHYAIGKRDPYTNEALNSLRGYWGLREAKDDARITLAIHPGDGKSSVEPAPYFTLRPDKPRSLFYEDERVLCHLDFAEPHLVPGTWQLDWKLEDHCQRPAGSGRQEVTIAEGKKPDVTVDLTPREMGYFRARLVLSRPDGKAAQRLHELSFSRIRPECPALRELDAKGGVDGEMLWANILGMRGIRLNPSFANIWRQHHTEDGNVAWDAQGRDMAKHLEPARQGTLKGLFSFIGLDWSNDLNAWFEKRYPDPEERKKKVLEAKQRYLTEYAREAKKLGINAWEPINEPNLGMSPEKYIEEVLKFQYPAIKAGNPEANFLGGSICGLDNYGWVRRLYELGGDKFFDGVSFHPYTGLGFQEVYRAELDQWWQILRDFKDTAQGLWMTESAWHRGWMFNDYVYDRFKAFRQSQARNAVLMHLNAEAMAIPRDRIYVFYLVEHGYNEFFLITYDYPTPPAIAIQVMNECLRDAKFAKEFPLPGKGHHFQLYQDKTRTVAVAFTNDEPAELDVATDASEVVATDLMGNRTTLKPANGKLRITMSGDPAYLVVGPQNTLAPLYDGLAVQPNLAIPTLGATASASSVAKPKKGEPLPTATAISGDWTCYGSAMALTGSRRGWDADESTKDAWPQWFEVKLPQAVPVARVRVYHDYGAWERVLRDYDVQVFAGGDWKTVDQVRGNRYRFIGDHRFEPVTTDRVRVLVQGVNACLFDSIPWIPRIATLRAVEVYGPSSGAAKAFFIEDLPRKRILAPGGTTELRFRMKNILDSKVTGELRLRLPEGVTAEPPAAKVSLEPKGEAECLFKVKLGDQAPESLYTVLAGLYEGDNLICPDYAARVLCCKKGSGQGKK